MKILAFAASNSSTSINKQLVTYASQLLTDGLVDDAEIELLDLNDFEMPIYSTDRENDGGVPALAQDFYDAITRSDAVLISFAEYNGSYTSAYKNLFDWASRIDMRVYQDKPTVMLSASPGPGGGGNVLATAVAAGKYFGNDVKASMSIPKFHENFDMSGGSVSNAEIDAELRTTLTTLA